MQMNITILFGFIMRKNKSKKVELRLVCGVV